MHDVPIVRIPLLKDLRTETRTRFDRVDGRLIGIYRVRMSGSFSRPQELFETGHAREKRISAAKAALRASKLWHG